MSYASNNGSFPTPQYISTIDLTTETKPKFVKYFYYTVFNFAKQYSNPLILPFPITLDVIYHGNIDIGSNQFKSKTFDIEQVTGNKFNISGEGTVYFWYRYGSIDPASFNLIAQTAINNQDWLVLDAILHTRSFIEVIDFLVNNPQTWKIISEGLDWQLNEIGTRDFFAYLTNNCYDTRKLAQFLTIMAYIDPNVLTQVGIPVYNFDNPNRTFEAYLQYLPPSCIAPVYSELSEQSSEISELFSQTSEINNTIFAIVSQIVQLIQQSSEQQSEINTLNSEVLSQASEIVNLLSITSEQASEISELFAQTSEISGELTQLSENLILFTDAGKIINEVLTIFHLFKATLTILKIIQQVVQTIAPLSELTVISETGCALNWLLGLVSEGLSDIISETDLQQTLQQLVNFLNNLLGINISGSVQTNQNNQSNQDQSSGFNFSFHL